MCDKENSSKTNKNNVNAQLVIEKPSCCNQIKEAITSCCTEKNEENEKLKTLVKEGYSKISNQSKTENEQSLCGISGSCCVDFSIFAEDYSKLDGYCESADLGLGCGVPTSSGKIKEGDIVLDLGSGAGNDCFIARKLVGEKGKVIGLDMTPDMLRKAWLNTDTMGYNNVEFRLGEIEDMPISDSVIDVVISNCVINLVPDKTKAFKEIHRVLKKDGFFSISDVVTTAPLPETIKKAGGMYVGCVSGALVIDDYIKIINDAGFKFSIAKQKQIIIPDSVYLDYMNEKELQEYKDSNVKILSITVVAQKQ